MKLTQRKNKGQSLIEFALAVTAFFSVLFMYVQVALSLGVGNCIHYATFMSARALLSAAETPASQEAAARTVLQSMLKRGNQDRFRSIAQGVGEGDPTGAFVGSSSRVVIPPTTGGARARNWEQGVSYKFKAKMQMVPILKGFRGSTFELESESWLGREPSEKECIDYMSSKAKQVVFDNGC